MFARLGTLFGKLGIVSLTAHVVPAPPVATAQLDFSKAANSGYMMIFGGFV